MDVCSNPFSCAPGARPLFLAGRTQVLGRIETLAHQLASARPSPMIAITGMAGMGVTSTLLEARERLGRQRWGVAYLSASEVDDRRPLRVVIADALDRAVGDLEGRATLDRRMARLRQIVEGLRTSPGSLAFDLLETFRELGTTLADHQAGVLVMVDDAHRLGADSHVLAAVGGASSERGLPATVLLGAYPMPIPQLEVIEIGPLRSEQVEDLLVETASQRGVEIQPGACARVAELSRGVPFMIQAFAHHAWNECSASPILGPDVDAGAGEARGDLVSMWFTERTEQLDPAQRRYLIAVKELGSHGVPIAHVARRVGESARLDGSSTATTTLEGLVRRGLVCRRDDQTVGFTLAAFDRYVDTW